LQPTTLNHHYLNLYLSHYLSLPNRYFMPAFKHWASARSNGLSFCSSVHCKSKYYFSSNNNNSCSSWHNSMCNRCISNSYNNSTCN
jgi:hypothetical protein